MENVSITNTEAQFGGFPSLAESHHDFIERVEELGQLWRLGAETEVLASRLFALRASAEQYFEQAIAALGGLSDSVLLQYTCEHEDMVRKIDAVLADFAAGDGAVHWLEMIAAIEEVRHHDILDGKGAFFLQEDQLAEADPLIPWSKDLEIGIEWMDQHHRGLIDIINEIARLPKYYDLADADALMERLRRLAWHHFHEEEARLPSTTHDAVQQHVAQHRHLVAELDQLIFDVRSRRVDLGIAVKDRLCRWLIDHIKTADRDDFQSVLK